MVLNIALKFNREKLLSISVMYNIRKHVIEIFKKYKLIITYNKVKDDFINNSMELRIYSRYPIFNKMMCEPEKAYNDIMIILNNYEAYIMYKFIWIT